MALQLSLAERNSRGRIIGNVSISLNEIESGVNLFIDAEEFEANEIEVTKPDGEVVTVTKEQLKSILKSANNLDSTDFKESSNGSYFSTCFTPTTAEMSDAQAKAFNSL